MHFISSLWVILFAQGREEGCNFKVLKFSCCELQDCKGSCCKTDPYEHFQFMQLFIEVGFEDLGCIKTFVTYLVRGTMSLY